MLFRERLSVPLLWWVLAGLMALSLLLAFGLYLGPAWGVGVTAATIGVAIAVFRAAAVRIVVDADRLTIGRAVIDRAYVAGVVALDEPAASLRAGGQADARAHLVLRSYVPTAVEITLDDPADPVPYWLVSSRRPAELAAAWRQAAPSAGGR